MDDPLGLLGNNKPQQQDPLGLLPSSPMASSDVLDPRNISMDEEYLNRNRRPSPMSFGEKVGTMIKNVPQSALDIPNALDYAFRNPARVIKNALYALPEVPGKVAEFAQHPIDKTAQALIENPVQTIMAMKAMGNLFTPAGASAEISTPGILSPERIYGSATKMPLSKKWTQTLGGQEMSDRAKAIKAGIENKVHSNEYGISKAKALEKQSRQAVDDLISQGAMGGKTASTEDIISKGLDKAYNRASKSSDPIGAKKIVDEVAEKFRAHGPTITIDKLNEIKRQLYDEVKWGGSEQTALVSQLTTMGKKGMANAAKEHLESIYPELKALNQKDSAYIKLTEALERASGREQNKDIIGLGAKALAVRNIPMAIVEATIGHPYVKESLAFALDDARKAMRNIPGPVKTAGKVATKTVALAPPIINAIPAKDDVIEGLLSRYKSSSGPEKEDLKKIIQKEIKKRPRAIRQKYASEWNGASE